MRVVTATCVDPVPGWADNIYGMNGALYGFGKGVIRVLYCNKDYLGDLIPADFVANSTLAVAWITAKEMLVLIALDFYFFKHLIYVIFYFFSAEKNNATNNNNKVKVYNSVSSVDNPITWGTVSNEILRIYNTFPLENKMWHTVTNFTPSLFLFKLLTIIYHILPAIPIDIYLKSIGKKFSLVRVYRITQKNILAGSCFMKDWKFENRNMRKLFETFVIS